MARKVRQMQAQLTSIRSKKSNVLTVSEMPNPVAKLNPHVYTGPDVVVNSLCGESPKNVSDMFANQGPRAERLKQLVFRCTVLFVKMVISNKDLMCTFSIADNPSKLNKFPESHVSALSDYLFEVIRIVPGEEENISRDEFVFPLPELIKAQLKSLFKNYISSSKEETKKKRSMVSREDLATRTPMTTSNPPAPGPHPEDDP
ncbi:unnamed protein product [Caenorhabditis sp. 36 PRJEB53466]|nr:unnamed protein product [Caenorhabditis sp. 36 PRJEB53466]